jgi:hypothetical protein
MTANERIERRDGRATLRKRCTDLAICHGGTVIETCNFQRHQKLVERLMRVPRPTAFLGAERQLSQRDG